MNVRRLTALLIVPVIGIASMSSASADERQIAEKMHMGVASCASSVCHGKLQRQTDQNVWLNEYRIWTGAGVHSQAYRTLESEESKQIAANLGLPSATTATVCLDCHADNVPTDKRGPRFQIRDGVGCEACHGGAEEWIESHAADGATHQANLRAGMYPTESPASRAEVCLSCHMGNSDKLASHDIMGAGHPRLSFELEAFQTNQPAHFDVDDDYVARKGEISGFQLWLAGQIEAAARFSGIVRNRIAAGGRPYPELALYDCHACHHVMDDKRWTPVRGAGAGPGALRIQDQHALILVAVVGVLESEAARNELQGMVSALIAGGHTDVATASVAAGRLSAWLRDRQRAWATRQFSNNEVRAVRRAIVNEAARGRMSDFAAAEQVMMAAETLSYALGDWDSVSPAIDRLFREVTQNGSYDPASFARTAANVLERF